MPKHVTTVDQQVLLAGPAVVSDNALPPGLYVPRPTTFTNLIGRLGTAPTGGPLTVLVTLGGTAIYTLTFSAGSTTAASALTAVVPAGSYLQFNVTAIGATTPGSDLSLALLGFLT